MPDKKIILTTEQIGLIEELANITEIMGTQPAVSKILALLTVSDQIELTFDEIKETLGLSKSAVSQSLSLLLKEKKIGYKTKIGDRKRYFYLKVDDIDTRMIDIFDNVATFIAVHRKVLAARSPETQEFNQNLEKLTNFLSSLHNQVTIMIKKHLQEEK